MLTRATETLIEQSLLYPGGFISPLEIEDAVTRALAEDLGRAGDVTSIATIPAGTPSRTVLVARKPGTISGLPLVAACLRKLAPDIEIATPVRRAYFGQGQGQGQGAGWLETRVVNRSALNAPREGPCIVEEYDSTCLIPPGWTARLDEYGNVVLGRPG